MPAPVSPLELECYPVAARPPEITPGRPNRGWMDRFAERHPDLLRLVLPYVNPEAPTGSYRSSNTPFDLLRGTPVLSHGLQELDFSITEDAETGL